MLFIEIIRTGETVMRSNRRVRYAMGTAIILLSTTLMPGTALAQSAAPSDAATPANGDIVVTANKRAERLLDVPASVSAVTGATLLNTGAAQIADYAAKVPGLVVDDGAGANYFSVPTIRGLNTNLGGNPTVGIYVDDSPYGSTVTGTASLPDLDPIDLDRVEVLRGPQGTLYGAGSLGGIIKFVTAAPDPTRFFGRAEADGTFAAHGDEGYALRGAVNIPVTENLAIRVSGLDRRDPGFIDNVQTGEKDINDSLTYGGRFALGWRFASNWHLKVSALIQRTQNDGVAVSQHDPVTEAPIYGTLDQAMGPGTGKTLIGNAVYNAEISGDLGFATLTSATSYDRQRTENNLDVTDLYGTAFEGLTPAGSGIGLQSNGLLHKVSQELRLASPETDRFSWLVGAFYTHESHTYSQGLYGFDESSGSINTPSADLLDSRGLNQYSNVSVFGDATFRITQTWDVTGGIRYSHDQLTSTQSAVGILATPGQSVINSHDDPVTFLASTRLHLTPNAMIYARVASGFRPGGPNAISPGVPGSYGPDKVTNYEAGLKATLFDNLEVSLAGYWIDWKGIQVSQLTAGGFSYIANGGRARSAGAEFEATWHPIAGLSISGNASYDRAELRDDLTGGAGIGFSGDQLPSTPKFAGQISGDYEFPLNGNLRGFVGADYHYVGRRDGQFQQDASVPRYRLPAYNVGDLRAGVKFKQWTFTTYVKNVGDSHGQVTDTLVGLYQRVAVIRPRTVGIMASVSF
jgi:outer membrane receptor protein involved in Fe transport